MDKASLDIFVLGLGRTTVDSMDMDDAHSLWAMMSTVLADRMPAAESAVHTNSTEEGLMDKWWTLDVTDDSGSTIGLAWMNLVELGQGEAPIYSQQTANGEALWLESSIHMLAMQVQCYKYQFFQNHLPVRDAFAALLEEGQSYIDALIHYPRKSARIVAAAMAYIYVNHHLRELFDPQNRAEKQELFDIIHEVVETLSYEDVYTIILEYTHLEFTNAETMQGAIDFTEFLFKEGDLQPALRKWDLGGDPIIETPATQDHHRETVIALITDYVAEYGKAETFAMLKEAAASANEVISRPQPVVVREV